jgi:hypothetical protein
MAGRTADDVFAQEFVALGAASHFGQASFLGAGARLHGARSVEGGTNNGGGACRPARAFVDLRWATVGGQPVEPAFGHGKIRVAPLIFPPLNRRMHGDEFEHYRGDATMRWAMAAALAVAAWGLATAADEPKPADKGDLIIVDAAGKEQKAKTWKFEVGVRRLGWLADKDHGDKTGPEALEFRDDDSTNYEEGIVTLVPLDRIQEVEFDNDKDVETVKALVGPKAEDVESLTGPTKFKGINKITISAEVDKGDMGVAEFKYLGGIPKGIRGVRFPTPKAPAAAAAGRPAVVVVVYKNKKTTFKVSDLQPLYRTAAGEQLAPTLFFKKTLKVDVAKVQKFTAAETEDDPVWNVTMKEGGEETLTPILKPMLNDKPAVLEGLLGRIPSGYKLFPAHVLTEVIFDAAEAPAEK